MVYSIETSPRFTGTACHRYRESHNEPKGFDRTKSSSTRALRGPPLPEPHPLEKWKARMKLWTRKRSTLAAGRAEGHTSDIISAKAAGRRCYQNRG